MKGSILAAAAALAGGVSAARVHHRHAAAHDLFQKRGHAEGEVCTTIVNTIYGEMSTFCEITWKLEAEKRSKVLASDGRCGVWIRSNFISTV